MKNPKISVASYSFHGAMEEGKCDVFNYLNLLKYRYGLTTADIWSGFLPNLEDDFILKLRKAMDREGIELANLCVDGPYLWVDDPQQRAAHKKKMLEYIQVANKLGAKTVRIDFGGPEGHTMPEEAFEYIVNTYKEYCKICGELGMKIGPENHWGWDRVPEYLEKVKNAVDHPAYGQLFHFGNFFDEHEKGEALALTYAMHTHIHAYSVPYAKEIICKLKAFGYEGAYSIEHHSGKLEAERVDWQLATVRGLMAELESGDEGEDFFTTVYNTKERIAF